MKKYRIIYISLALLATSCHKQKIVINQPATSGIYITNEGNFNGGNGEVSFYDPVKQTISNNLFYPINGYHLGDVVQSIYVMDSVGFIVVNNSAKIEKVKIPSLEHIITINIPNSSPRYFLPVNDSAAYVTDLYAGAIHVINYHTGHLIINISGVAVSTEHMVMVNGIVAVEEHNLTDTSTTGSIITINPSTNTVINRYSFRGNNVDGIVTDNLNRIWFGMDAYSVRNIPASIYCLNSDMSLAKNIVLAPNHAAFNLKINGAGNEVYYLDNNGIAAMSVDDTIAPVNPLVPVNGRNLYGLGVDPNNGNIYVSDALDYEQPSVIYRYDKNGSLIQSFTGGLISGNFAFNGQ